MDKLLSGLLITAIILILASIVVSVSNTPNCTRNHQDGFPSVEDLHTAKLYEDGSWTAEYQSGETVSGCKVNGLCQD